MFAAIVRRFTRLRRIVDRADKTSPYLDRHYIFGDASSRWFLALHKIHRSDADIALHDHSWPYYALQLSGHMLEVQPSGVYKRRPGYLRVRGSHSLHRLILPAGKPVWSLFLGGPRSRRWCFMIDGKRVDYARHLGQ